MHRRNLLAPGLSSLALALSAAPVLAANVASPGVNPNVRVTGTTTFGDVSFTNNLNDGVNPDTVNGSFWQVPTPGTPPPPATPPAGSRGFGYDFGGFVTIESLDLSQHVGDSPLGPRARLANVVVHTAAGDFPFSLADQNDNTLTLPGPVTTNWLMVETLTQHPGNDPQVGIDELAVNSAAGTVAPNRVNVAQGRPFTLQPTPPAGGWNNVNGNLTDNILASSGGDLSTAMFNSDPKAAGVSIDIDLGSSQTIDRLGLAEQDYGGAGGRQLIQNMTVLVDDDPAFGSPEARSLSLENIPYQQVDFTAATGQFVRLTFQSQYANPDQNLGFTEVQIFQAIPEPAALALAALGLPLLARRRRR
jgi:hypothetical protein